MSNEQAEFKSGFVSLIGRTNVGKSTLLNRILGQKIAIMSDKPQTTRNKIQMVCTGDNYQIVFLDTPGMHKPKNMLGGHLIEVTLRALKEMDVVLFMTEPFSPGKGDRYILAQLKELQVPVFLIVNKIDNVDRDELLKVITDFQYEFHFAEIIPLSALTGENIEKLLEQIIRYLPEGPKYYPDEMVTDRPERFIAAELIREKALHLTSQEVPHSVTVDIEEVKQRPQGAVYINAIIYVERDSQKAILIGKKGSMLKKIGELARKDIEELLGSNLYLDLWVKVKKDWRNRGELLKTFGYIEN